MKLVLEVLLSYIGLRKNIPTIHSTVETNISPLENSVTELALGRQS